MIASVRTKPQKKQPSSDAADGFEAFSPALTKSMLKLEAVCQRIFESNFGASRRDVERLYWRQRFKNIATPVSLALAEMKGPRRFHNHYKHREDDDSVLTPVLENPVTMLAHACETALEQCRKELVGIEDDGIIARRDKLEAALLGVLLHTQK